MTWGGVDVTPAYSYAQWSGHYYTMLHLSKLNISAADPLSNLLCMTLGAPPALGASAAPVAADCSTLDALCYGTGSHSPGAPSCEYTLYDQLVGSAASSGGSAGLGSCCPTGLLQSAMP